ncbi:MAG: hypothetical protein RIC35_18360 [Marinoscillum sp.]
MEIEGSYIQCADGFDKDDITLEDVDRALKALQNMDDEHGAFWVSVYGAETEEMVLEIYKSLKLFGNFGNKSLAIQLTSFEKSKPYFNLLLAGEIDKLKERMNEN